MTRKETIQKRQSVEKNLLLEQFRKTPIIQIACDKVGVGRTTYYRWRKQSKKFAEMADEALLEGELLVNDVAESQLINLIRNQKMEAVRFWLTHHHPKYGNKLEITGKVEHKLTDDQKKMLKKALKFANSDYEK